MSGTREEVNLKAITKVPISGSAIKTIPAGTEFTITHMNIKEYADRSDSNYNSGSSACTGLGVTEVWNNEFDLLEQPNEK